MIPPLLDWMVFNASFSFGTVNLFGFEIKFSEEMATNQNCGRVGACWPYIYEKLYMYTYGFYPRTESWSPNTVFALTALLFVIVPLVKYYKYKNWVTLSLIIAITLIPALSNRFLRKDPSKNSPRKLPFIDKFAAKFIHKVEEFTSIRTPFNHVETYL